MADLSHHINDLITAYSAMPHSERRDLVIAALKRAYLYATSDELTNKGEKI
jgi:hypothetical protein